MSFPKLSVVIPMYNEEKIAAETAMTLYAFLKDHDPSLDFEVVFADDGSRDNCGEIVRRLNLPQVRVVGYPDNRGKGSAVREGVLDSEGEIVVYTDCDLAYGCQAILDIVERQKETGADIVIGSRAIHPEGYAGYSFLRKLMSRVYLKTVAFFAGFRHSDSQCGLKCLKKEAAHDIFGRCTINSFAFDLEMLILAEKLGYTVAEQPAKIINNRESESRVNPIKDAIKMLGDVKRIKKLHKNVK